MNPWILILIAFVLGSIPFGYLISKGKGIDIRQHGSGNIGSTNVSRVLGKKWGIFVFGLDFLKGWAAVFLFKNYHTEASFGGSESIVIGSAVAVILGHNYTPWLKFKGGKGIATSAGVLLALMPAALIVGALSWGIVMKISKTVSIASLTACVVVPLSSWFFYPDHRFLFVFALVAGLLGIWRHRSNIQRLMAGEEFTFKNESKSEDSP